jgi:hypothetical protein
MAFNRAITIQIGPKDGEKTIISDLFISFEVEKTINKATNIAKVSIANLSSTTLKKVAVVGNQFVLSAGYLDEDISNIFFGGITRTSLRKDNSTLYLDIEAHDGLANINSAVFNKSYNAGTLVSVVIKDIVAAIGYPAKGFDKIPTGTQYPNGILYSGKAVTVLQEALNKIGLKYSIQNEQIVIFKSGELGLNEVALISYNTGLLNDPEPIEDGTDALSTAKVKGRWRLNTLLSPKIVPGSKVQLETSAMNTELLVENIKYVGGNWEGDFRTTIEAVEL